MNGVQVRLVQMLCPEVSPTTVVPTTTTTTQKQLGTQFQIVLYYYSTWYLVEQLRVRVLPFTVREVWAFLPRIVLYWSTQLAFL
jgi:hypothetical protein